MCGRKMLRRMVSRVAGVRPLGAAGAQIHGSAVAAAQLVRKPAPEFASA
jgi:hypothetical protein